MVSESKLEAKWAKIPHDIDILITHSPPFAILDQDYMGINCGDIALKERIDQISLKLHVFGHIHAGHGQVKFSGTMFVNAAHMNDNYEPVNKPIRVVL
jgi:Icc-related predicted phosphoesterase